MNSNILRQCRRQIRGGRGSNFETESETNTKTETNKALNGPVCSKHGNLNVTATLPGLRVLRSLDATEDSMGWPGGI